MNRAINRLNSVHEKLLDTVNPLHEQIFSKPPSTNQWSIAEIVHHLCLVEERVIHDLEKELDKPARQIGFLRKLVPTSIVSSRLIRVQAPKAVNPRNAPTKDANIAKYNSARVRLKELYSTHGEARLKQVVFKHPFLGEISFVATISFVGYHELRHYKQICEVLKKIGM